MAPRGPQKGQKSILMGSLVVLDPNASPKKISSIFGTGCHKACTCPLNGACCVFDSNIQLGEVSKKCVEFSTF